MKKILLIFLIMAGQAMHAQDPYSNHWIDFGQEYLKLPFRESGVYRLHFKDIRVLDGATLRPHDIRVIQRGREILKTGAGLDDGRFDEGDYFEFYLQANQGEQDSLVYLPHAHRPPVNDNLFSDESYIFVTVGPARGRSYTPAAFKSGTNPEDFHIAHEITSFKDSWSFNNLIGLVPIVQQSYYERAESWSGPLIYSDGSASRNVQLSNYSPQPGYGVRFEALIYTRSHVYHDITARINHRTFGNIRHIGFDHFTLGTTLSEADLGEGHSFLFTTESGTKDPAAAYSWTQFTVTYPQKISLAGRDTLTLNLVTSAAATGHIRTGSPGLLAYDITDPASGKRLPVSEDLVFTENRAGVKRIFLTRKLLGFDEGRKIIFQRPSVTANYLIITHPTLRPAAEEYRDYRQATGGYEVELLEIQSLYDQFNYGERSPIAIREYLRFQLHGKAAQDRFLLLVGKPVSFPNSLKTDVALDLVPSFGYPGSDHLFSAGLGGLHPDVAAYLTGRIAARQNHEIQSYLAKVKEYESQEVAPWRKEVLHLNGGVGSTEINQFKAFMEQMNAQAETAIPNLPTTHLVKNSAENVEQVNISRQTNAGLGFISYFGHGSSSTLDFNFGYASDPERGFSNKGKYPFMYFNGCGVSNVFYRYNPLSTDWLFTPDKGAIAVLANSFWAYSSSSMSFLKTFYSKLFSTEELLGQPVGRIIREAIMQETQRPDYNAFDQSNSHQLILQGDPAVVVNPFHAPDYTFEEGSLGLHSLHSTVPLKAAEQVVISATMQNLGKIIPNQTVTVTAELEYADGTVEQAGTVRIKRSFGSVYADTLTLRSPVKKISLVIDGQLTELNKENNAIHLDVDWEDAQNNALYPYVQAKDMTPPVLMVYINETLPATSLRVYPEAPVIRFVLKDENRLTAEGAKIRAFLKVPGSDNFLPFNDFEIKLLDHNTLEGNFLSPGEKGNYELILNGSDAAGNLTGQDLRLSWTIGQETVTSVMVSPNPSRGFVRFSIQSPASTVAQLTLTDLLGRPLHQGRYALKGGPNEVFLSVQTGSGAYWYTLLMEGEKYTGRLIVI